MNNYTITIEVLEKELDIVKESNDIELVKVIETTLKYLKDVSC